MDRRFEILAGCIHRVRRSKTRALFGASLVAGAALSLLAAWPLRVLAQEEAVPLERLEVALWPEYDRPGVLVIYRFQLSAESPLPAQVRLPIPASIGQPNAVAWQDDDQALYDAVYAVETAGEWTTVLVEMRESRSGQLEYYADLSVQGELRTFRFEWPGGVETGAVSYEVQQPVTALDLTITPAPDSQNIGPFGLNYSVAILGPLDAGSRWAIDMSYRKADSILTVEALQPLGEPNTPTSSVTAPRNLLPWLLGGLGLAMVAGGAIYFSRSRAVPSPEPRRRRSAAAEPEIDASAIFCHQCGTRAQISDKFCRNCGTRLRT